MVLFAQIPNPATMTAEQIATLPAEQVALLKADQLGALLKRQDELRWASELPYFRELHNLLPEPFFHTQGFLLFLLMYQPSMPDNGCAGPFGPAGKAECRQSSFSGLPSAVLYWSGLRRASM